MTTSTSAALTRIGLACRIIIACVFLAAAVPKIADPHAFALSVFHYQMLPYSLINIAALVLPWLELICALTLLGVPRLRDAAALWILGLLILFTVAITINVFRGIDIACGCFSVSADGARLGWRKVAENVGLILVAAIALVDSRRLRGATEKA